MKKMMIGFIILIVSSICFFTLHVFFYINCSKTINNINVEKYDYFIPNNSYSYNPVILLENGIEVKDKLVITTNNLMATYKNNEIIIDKNISIPNTVTISISYEDVKKDIDYLIINEPKDIVDDNLIYNNYYYLGNNYNVELSNGKNNDDYFQIINSEKSTIIRPLSIGIVDLKLSNSNGTINKSFNFKFLNDTLTEVFMNYTKSEIENSKQINIYDDIESIDFTELKALKPKEKLTILSNKVVDITYSDFFNVLYVLDDNYKNYEDNAFFYKIYPISGIVIEYPDSTIDIIDDINNYSPKEIKGYRFKEFEIKNSLNQNDNLPPKKYKAIYEQINYSIIIDNGYSDTYTIPIHYNDIFEMSRLSSNRNGYFLIGWYLDSNLITENQFVFNYEHDIKISAKWGFSYNVKYDLDYNVTNKNEFEVVSVKTTEEFKLTTSIPKKDGYTFKYWLLNGEKYVDQDLNDYVNNPNDEIHLIPYFVPNTYQIHYEDENGIAKTIDVIYDQDITLPNVNKDNYIFEGWYCDSLNQLLDSNIKYVYAYDLYVKPIYSYSFNVEYYLDDTLYMTKTYSSKNNNYLIEIDSNPGYEICWKYNGNEYAKGEKIEFNTEPKAYKVYSVKKPISYYLVFAKDGGSINASERVECKYGESYVLNYSVSISGGQFSHYLINGVIYHNGDSFSNLTTNANADILVLLVYKYKITVNTSYNDGYHLKINGQEVSSGSYASQGDNISISLYDASGRTNTRITSITGIDGEPTTFNMPKNSVIINITSDEYVEPSNPCIIEGTRIMLADGTYKNVEDITENDILASFNHNTGMVEAARGFFDPEDHVIRTCDVIYLYFSNGESIRMTTEHRFYDVTLRKYVLITNDSVSSYVGDEFLYISYDNEFNYNPVYLINYEIIEEAVRCYSPTTYGNINIISNNLLSASGGNIDWLLNYFEFDENYKYDEDKKQNDIEKYGYLSYEYFKDYVSYELFEEFNGKYLSIAIGKGLCTYDEIISSIEYYFKGEINNE